MCLYVRCCAQWNVKNRACHRVCNLFLRVPLYTAESRYTLHVTLIFVVASVEIHLLIARSGKGESEMKKKKKKKTRNCYYCTHNQLLLWVVASRHAPSHCWKCHCAIVCHHIHIITISPLPFLPQFNFVLVDVFHVLFSNMNTESNEKGDSHAIAIFIIFFSSPFTKYIYRCGRSNSSSSHLLYHLSHSRSNGYYY